MTDKKTGKKKKIKTNNNAWVDNVTILQFARWTMLEML